MAEKNTLSILETIKKKMNSFDQKSAKDVPVSDVRKELDYNSPPKNKIEEKPIEEVKKIATLQAEPENDKIDDINNDKIDDINFDDFDLDDENKIIQDSSINPLSETTEVEENEDDIEDEVEDYEDVFDEDLDDLNLIEEFKQIQGSQDQKIEKEEVEEKKDDFDFADALPTETESEETEEKSEEVQVAIPTEDKKDEILEEEKPEIFELNSDEIEPLEIQKTEEQKDLNQKTVEAKSEALGIEDEIFKLPPAIETKTDAKVEELDDFDELHKDLASDDHHEISVEKNILSDDLKFEESHLETASEPEETELSLVQEKSDDLNLDEFDSINLAENSSQKKSEEKPSSHDEIDLEFEKEIMGLKPEVTDKNTKQESAEKIFEQPIVQQTELPKQEIELPKQEIIKQNFSAVFSVQNSSPNVQNNPQNNGAISDVTVAKATDSIKKLIDAKNVVNGISAFSQSPAFAEIAVQLMEPKLEKWLNDNLPELVENIVREEIKKIIPK